MVKAVKRLTWLICTFAMALVLTKPVSVNAEEERSAVYVQVPADWDAPCVWAWDEDGNNAFEAWPGGETEAYLRMVLYMDTLMGGSRDRQR